MQLFDTPVRICDSQYFLLPLLRLRGVAGVVSEPLHTLAQLFIEVFDRSVSAYTVHLQTYTYNDLYAGAIAASLGPLRPFFPMDAFLGRLLLFQGYFHSDESPGISATLERNADGDLMRLRRIPNPETRKRIGRLAAKLTRLSGKTGFLPLLPLLQMGKPGRGFHSGGSFPMRARPGPGESDTLGRVHGWKRVHAVDSSILPSITAATITFTVMANAWRIGNLVGRGLSGQGEDSRELSGLGDDAA
jgi:choline dehydrogenase-like flavoprotein